jgi:hypothetical protein
MKSVFFDPITGDPTGNDYGNQTGGLRFEASTNRFRYKGGSSSDPTVQWRYFGDGDGDVTYFGTEQFDNGVARWHSVTRQIQGSVASLDDSGNFSTPGYYQSRPANAGDPVFISRPAGLSKEKTFSINREGKFEWGPGGALGDPPAQPDINLERLGALEIGSTINSAKLSLTQGDSRISAQRMLAGIGNTQVGRYRCPVVYQGTMERYTSPAYATTSVGEEKAELHHSFTLPANSLEIGQQCVVTVNFQTANTSLVKGFRMKIDGLGIQVDMSVAGASAYSGRMEFTILYEAANTLNCCVTGLHGGGGTSNPNNSDFSSGYNAGSNYTVDLYGFLTADGSAVGGSTWIVNGGKIVYYCE